MGMFTKIGNVLSGIPGKADPMGFLFGSSKADVPPVPPPPAPIPQAQDPQIARAGQDARKRARMAAGFGANLQTGPQGLTSPAVTTGKSLLGS